jgi:hypothetical protein
VFGAFAPVPAWLALLVAFAGGVLFAALLGFYQIAKLGLVTRRYRKAVRGLESEVHQLRSLPLVGEEPRIGGAGEEPIAVPRALRERGG